MPIRLSNEKIQQIIQLYQSGLTCRKISKLTNICRRAISKYLKINNVIMKYGYEQHSKNSNFFDVIDTEEKAYFLGLLYADGCNSGTRISIGLVEEDRDILDKFSSLIFAKKKELAYRPPFQNNINGNITQGRAQRIFSVCSKYMVSVLERHGMTRNKSFTLQFPTTIPEHLIHHFVRGYFDGDGCISMTRKKLFFISIVGSVDFCKELKQIIETKNKSHCTLFINKKYSKDMGRVSIAGNFQVFRFLSEFLYRDATVFLKRKYERYQTLINCINNSSHPISLKKRRELEESSPHCKEILYQATINSVDLIGKSIV